MNNLMLEATRLTRAGKLAEATALLQRMLRGGGAGNGAPPSGGDGRDAPAGHTAPLIDAVAETIETTDPSASGGAPSGPAPGAKAGPHLPKALRGLLDRFKGIG